MEKTLAKPRVRVPARSVASDSVVRSAPMPSARYLRDTGSRVIAARMAPLTLHRDEVRRAWSRAAGIAMDIMQNSGRIRGVADQVIADTIGVDLTLNPMPDLSGLNYSDKEKSELIALLRLRWKQWWWNARECDARGKFTGPQQIDVALRHDMIYGEVTGVLTYMTRSQRAHYGITSGTKLCLVAPHRLVQDTSEMEGMFQGVIHDPNGRPVAYRFLERETGLLRKKDWRAHDADGRPVVIHLFDAMDTADVRGISRLASAFRKYLQQEIAEDATLQTLVLQSIFAATITSDLPSAEAFEAIEAIRDADGTATVYNDFMGMINAQLETARESQFRMGGDSPQINHLAPGEKFQMHTAQTPGNQFLPYNASLNRDMARAIGVTYGGFTMDHSDATYASVRMEGSSIWPVVMRRRERVAAPIYQSTYGNWLDEEVGEGRIPFKGGYEAFAANRDRVCWAQWRGPAKPTADDAKAAKASSERIANGTASLEDENAELGRDGDEVFEARLREHRRYVDAGMVSPFERGFNLPVAKDDEVEPDDARPPKGSRK